jgi:O-antigen/teichoic acid export membrane protein
MAAYFYLPWIINFSAGQLPTGISSALVVESSYEGEISKPALRRSIRYGGAIVLVCTLAEFFVVPYLLRFAGEGYAEEGTTLIRVLALALPFAAVNGLYGTFAWVEQRLWRLVALQAVMTVVLLGGSLLFLEEKGIVAVGVSYLVAHALLALGSLPPIVNRMRAPSLPIPSASGKLPE